MPIPVGYDPTLGYIPATGPVVLANLKETYIAETNANVDVEEGPAADMLRTMGQISLTLWQDAEGVYNSAHIQEAPGTNGVAEGSSLEILLTPKIGPKIAATSSVVDLTLNAAAGPAVNIPAGTQVKISFEADPWEIVTPVVIPGGGSVVAEFAFTSTGPKQAIAGLSWDIVTPVTGWASIDSNAAPAVEGRNRETDDEYRTRYREALGDNFVAAIGRVEGVVSVTTIEHPSGIPDAFWGLTHWVEALVVGGDDAEVGAAINRARAKGVRSVGNVSVIIPNTDYVSGQVEEQFSRPVPVPTFVELTITKGATYPGDNSPDAITAREREIKDSVIALYDTLVAGETISAFKIASHVQSFAGIPGIDDIDSSVDLFGPPVNTGTLTPGIREIYTIVAGAITVNGA